MLVAVTFALRPEFASWRRLRSFRRRDGEHGPTYATRVGGVDVRVVLTGVGRSASKAAVETMLQHRPDVCISSGLAGGLHEAFRVAEIVVGGRVRGHDGRSVESDPRLLALALSSGASAVTMYSSPIVVVSGEEKHRLRAIADAVDMESAAILAESSRLGIPCVAIRAISDSSTVDLPVDLNRTLTEQGTISPVRLIATLARRPQAVSRLVRLGLDGRHAAMALAAFLDNYIEQLGVS